MATCREFLIFLMFLGTVFLIMLYVYNWDMSQEKRGEKIYHQQNLRKHLIKKMCDSDKETFSEGRQNLETMYDKIYDNFIVDDSRQIIYCFIPKVACTNWKRIMFVLKQGKPYPDPASIHPSLVHGPNKLNLLKHLQTSERKEKLKKYTKFLFVRNPFVRLISAYRDKFQYRLENEYFYQNFGKVMLSLYGNQSDPPETMSEAHALGTLPSFHNFIQYLLDPRTEKEQPFDIHWRQMHRLCHPCLVRYDFVGHQETLQEDAEELLKMLKLEDDIKFPPSYENMTSSDSVMNWFRTVPLEDRRKLYKIYEGDFRLFGYRRPKDF